MKRRDVIKAMASVPFLSGAARAGAPDYGPLDLDLRPGAPAAEGFYFPAEWTRHERTIMQFPPARSWNRAYIAGARKEWSAVANAIARFEPVTMVVDPADRENARMLLAGEIERLELPLDEGWSRDSGPMILVNGSGERRVAGFVFNGWGRKMWPCLDDALVKARLAKHYGMPFHPTPLVLEGGAVALDGEGTCLTTEECLLNPNRNPGLSRADIEQGLKDWLGVEQVLWLGRGIVPDEVTDGHVDGIAAFAAPGVVLLHTTDDRSDPNYAITQDAKARLGQMTDGKGRKLEIIELPLGTQVAHMNFYICNGAVLVPVADDPREDDGPLAVLREVFPGREIVPLSGQHIAEGGGGIHCITQQVPAV
ncbi:MAG: agmatine deiminase family protein [Pseudomonadota bacterium]